MTQHQLAIDQLYEALVRAATAGDAAAYAVCFDEEGVIMPPHAPVVHGRARIQAWAARLFAHYSLDVSTFSMGVQVIRDGAAFSRYDATGDYIRVADGMRIPFNQKYLDVVRQSRDGWRMAAHMWSSSVPDASIWNIPPSIRNAISESL